MIQRNHKPQESKPLNKFIGKKIESSVALNIGQEDQQSSITGTKFVPHQIIFQPNKKPIQQALSDISKQNENEYLNQNLSSVQTEKSFYQQESDQIDLNQHQNAPIPQPNLLKNSQNQNRIEQKGLPSQKSLIVQDKRNIEDLVKDNNKQYLKEKQRKEQEKQEKIEQARLHKEKLKQQQQEIRQRNLQKTKKAKEIQKQQEKQGINTKKSKHINEHFYKSGSKSHRRGSSYVQKSSSISRESSIASRRNSSRPANLLNKNSSVSSLKSPNIEQLRKDHSKENRNDKTLERLLKVQDNIKKEKEKEKIVDFQEQTRQRVKMAQLKKKAQKEEEERKNLEKRIKQMDLHKRAQQQVQKSVLLKERKMEDEQENEELEEQEKQLIEKKQLIQRHNQHKQQIKRYNANYQQQQKKKQRSISGKKKQNTPFSNYNKKTSNSSKKQYNSEPIYNLSKNLKNQLTNIDNSDQGYNSNDSFLKFENMLLQEEKISKKSTSTSKNNNSKIDKLVKKKGQVPQQLNQKAEQLKDLDQTLEQLEAKMKMKGQYSVEDIQKEINKLMPVYNDLQHSVKTQNKEKYYHLSQKHNINIPKPPLKKENKSDFNKKQDLSNIQSLIQQQQQSDDNNDDDVEEEQYDKNEDSEDLSSLNEEEMKQYINHYELDSENEQNEEEEEEEQEEDIQQNQQKTIGNNNNKEHKEQEQNYKKQIQLIQDNEFIEDENSIDFDSILSKSDEKIEENYENNNDRLSNLQKFEILYDQTKQKQDIEQKISRSQSVRGILKNNSNQQIEFPSARKSLKSLSEHNQEDLPQNNSPYQPQRRSKTVTFRDPKDYNNNIGTQNYIQNSIQQQQYQEDMLEEDPISSIKELVERQKLMQKDKIQQQQFKNTDNQIPKKRDQSIGLYDSDVEIKQQLRKNSFYQDGKQDMNDISSSEDSDNGLNESLSILSHQDDYQQQQEQYEQNSEEQRSKIQEQYNDINEFFDPELDKIIFNLDADEILKMETFNIQTHF